MRLRPRNINGEKKVRKAANRPVALYIGSSCDVWPVVDLPQYDWLLLTSNPADPQGICYLELADFQAMVEERLAAYPSCGVWQMTEDNAAKRRWVFECGERRLTVYHSMWFPDDLSAAAKADLKAVSVLHVAGWFPLLQAQVVNGLNAGLCPKAKKFYMHEISVEMGRDKELERAVPGMELIDYRVRDGYWVVSAPVISGKPPSFKYVWADHMASDEDNDEHQHELGAEYEDLIVGEERWPAAIPTQARRDCEEPEEHRTTPVCRAEGNGLDDELRRIVARLTEEDAAEARAKGRKQPKCNREGAR